MNENPFHLNGYHGPEAFCDRNGETAKLASNVENGLNTTLLSIRRMGKTGLIYHAFEKMQRKRTTYCIYVDIFATQSLRDFTNAINTAIAKTFPEKQTFGKKFMLWIKAFRPTLSYDPLSGSPEISLDFTQPKQYEQSLARLFQFLDSQGKRIVIAIDEFQQITNYPEKNMEALLRSLIQPLKNTRFIFSGSNKHLLSEMFNSSKRPFFSSTQFLYLGPIAESAYQKFIVERLPRNKIDKEALDYLCDFSRLHTYYTQVLCNRIYASPQRRIGIDEIKQIAYEVLKEQENIFFQYRNLITSQQWQLMKAIAHEDKVYKPTAKDFIRKYHIGNPSNVQRALEALLNKELVYKERDENGMYYRVYDCFLARWLARL